MISIAYDLQTPFMGREPAIYRSGNNPKLTTTRPSGNSYEISWKEQPQASTLILIPLSISELLEAINALDLDEDEDVKPTEYAKTLARKLLTMAPVGLNAHFSKSRVTVGPSGGLRLSWSNFDKEVRLICGGSYANKTYLYREQGDWTSVSEQKDGYQLAEWLRWLEA